MLFVFVNTIIGIDATGYSLTNASFYYTQRIRGLRKMKKHLKHSMIVDTKQQVILSSCYSLGPKHDNKDFKPLVQRVSKLTDFDVLVADKGYDCENNHRLVNSMNAISMIPVKKNTHRGRYRKKMSRIFDEKIYHQRSKVETVNFVKKQKFGSVVRSRNKLMWIKEGLLTDVCYNFYRYIRINSYFWIGFLQGWLRFFIKIFLKKSKLYKFILRIIYVQIGEIFSGDEVTNYN